MELFKSISVLVCVLLMSIVSCRRPKIGRIIHGVLDDINRMPYLVQFHNASGQICAGSIIASDKILTAAHCVVGQDQKRLKIVAGTSFLDHGGIERIVTKAVVSPDYNNDTMQNDYAVLKLNATLPMAGENITTIELCTESAPAGTNGVVGGWGITENGTKSNQLRSIIVPLIPNIECLRKYLTALQLIDTRTMICAAVPGVKDACRYDSGGPLVINRKVYGIVSWSIDCALPDFPGVYVDVCKLRESIAKLIADVD